MYYIIADDDQPAPPFSHLIRWHISNGYGIPQLHPDPATNKYLFALVHQDDETIHTFAERFHEMRPVLDAETNLRREGYEL